MLKVGSSESSAFSLQVRHVKYCHMLTTTKVTVSGLIYQHGEGGTEVRCYYIRNSAGINEPMLKVGSSEASAFSLQVGHVKYCHMLFTPKVTVSDGIYEHGGGGTEVRRYYIRNSAGINEPMLNVGSSEASAFSLQVGHVKYCHMLFTSKVTVSDGIYEHGGGGTEVRHYYIRNSAGINEPM